MKIGRLDVYAHWQHWGPNFDAIPKGAWVGPRRPGILPGCWKIRVNRGAAVLWIVGPLRFLWERKKEEARG